MSKRRAGSESLPACYALVQPGLEAIAADEIGRELGGEVKRTAPGIVVFRVPEIDASLLELRTTEDVFLLAWGTDQLTYRAEDLDRIRRWTAHDAKWEQLLRIHHAIRPKPKGKPTYHLVTQMQGVHGYRRVDAGKAFSRGLVGKFPESWRPASENAAVEFWLTIHSARAVCGLRLSDRTMRHRKYKSEHLPASLRPTVAAAMVRLADVGRRNVVLDPMCGAGTILAEVFGCFHGSEARNLRVLGGDREAAALRAAAANLRRLGHAHLARWDARRLPLADRSVDRIISNPPFGKQLSRPEEIGPLYRYMLADYDRVLRAGGRAVLLVGDFVPLRAAARKVDWTLTGQHRVRVLGQPAALTVWRKGDECKP
jgi:23S rRNA G2445 N2-methylase RlmL